ncbi:ribosome maturation factor RimM [Paenibacillus sp. GCM10027627]|uniref:ribosome maturation factor RimM n=1 Tax=unclassified Paenibacillus TaxID=185978 RepID=UPI003632AB01
MSEKWYTVGKIVNTHGIRGDIKVLSQTDFADERFAPGSKLRAVNEENGQSVDITVVSSREHKNMYYLKLEGYHNINDVEKYKGWILKIAESDQGDLEDGQYYYHQIIGCSVVTEDGEALGVISEVLSPGANDVWVVEGPKGKGKQVLLPVIDDVVLTVNVQDKLVTVRLMEGLI